MYRFNDETIIDENGEAFIFKTLGQAEKASRRHAEDVITIVNEKDETVEVLERTTTFAVKVKGKIVFPRDVTFRNMKG